ncbi:MAG: VanW family protein, partial [Armatimonadetes bacterium]|nr:VanW family protein [Armatimonadota bacterium]
MAAEKKHKGSISPGLYWTVLAVTGGVALVALALGFEATRFRSGDRIAPRVFVEGVDVGGLRASEARELLSSQVLTRLPQEVLLQWPGGSEKLSRAELGVSPDVAHTVRLALRIGRREGLVKALAERLGLRRSSVVVPLQCHVDTEQLAQAVAQLAAKADRPPADARVTVQDGRIVIEPEQVGVKVDVAATVEALRTVLANPHVDRVDLVVETQQPHILARDLQGFDEILGEYTTRYNQSQRGRSENLRLAASILNNTVLLPGDEFSVNERLGPRTVERGFKLAPTIINGEMKPTPGGGVCQIATTIYNAALLAGVKITERHHHSHPVPYVPAGRDATVYWGAQDFKFVNSLSHPLLLQIWADKGRLTVRLIGNHEDKRDVELVRSGVQWVSFAEKQVPDPSLKPGEKKVEKKGRKGLRVTLTRLFGKDGQVVKKEVLHTDYYPPQTRVVRVGPEAPWTPGAEEGSAKLLWQHLPPAASHVNRRSRQHCRGPIHQALR